MDKNNFAPRVGFAWSPRSSNSLLGDGRTVIRGGFGMGYDILFYNLLTVNGSNYPRVATFSDTNILDVYPNLLQAGGSPVFSPLNAYTNSDANTVNPDSKFWSFSIGREIGEFVIEAGYTGSRSGHGINQLHANPAVLTAEQAALVASTLSPNAIPSVQSRRVYPAFGVRTLIPAYTGPAGNDVEARSTYNGGYLSVSKRFAHGLQFQASYTRSRFRSNNDASLGETGTDGSNQRPQSMFNYDAEWSLSQFDVPNRFVVSYLWEVPGPKSGVLRHILGGWQFSGITAFQSGRPFTIGTGVDSNGDGTTGSDRPNLGSGTIEWDNEHRGFTNNGYAVAPLGNNNLPMANSIGDGTLGRNTLRAAAYWNTDLSLLKRFRVDVAGAERQIVIRADAFNAFNQDNYGIPVTNMSSASFGQNLGGAAPNGWGRRIVTVSAKFIW
jgi:hypothetical protein